MTTVLDPPRTVPADDLTRREVVIGAIGIALAAAGCGTDREPPAGDAAGGGFPRTIDHELGRARIPALPQRIVTTNEYAEVDALLALEVEPAAIGLIYDEPIPWRDPEATEGVPTFGGSQGSGEVPIERIAALRPDLILLTARDPAPETYARLERIAPTIATPAQVPGRESAWERTLDMVARAVGREGRVEPLVAAARARIAAARQAIAETGVRVVSLIAPYTGQGLFVFGDTSPQGLLLAELGLERPPGERRLPDAGNQELSLERIGQLDASDAVLVMEYDPPAVEALLRNPLVRNLRAARSGRIARLPSNVGTAIYFQSVLSVPWAAERIATALQEVA